jgi:hypothetical protein
VLLFSLVACGGNLVTIRVEENVSTTVERGTLLEDFVGDLGFDGFLDMDLTAAAELQNQGVEPEDITSARFEQFDLAATAPEGADLSFLETIALSVASPDLPTERFAHAEEFPEGTARVWLTLDDVDLKPYVVSQSMTIITDVTGHRPSEDVSVDAHFVVAVGVTTAGAIGEL